MVKLLRRGAVLGLLAGAAFAAWKVLAARAPRTDGMTFTPAPFPSPPRPVPRPVTPAPATSPTPWVDSDDGACPASHPVKAKIDSGIFHVPGGGFYDRTNADRCYLDAASAEADGLRPAKR